MAKLNKELLLALDFNSAPKELKDLAAKYRDSWLRLEKAEVQCQLWMNEERDAEIAADALAKEFRAALQAWDPAGAKTAKPEVKS